MESQEVKPTAKVGAIVGVVLIIIGIVIICVIAFITIVMLSHDIDRDQIWNIISSPSFWRMFGITFGIPIVVAIVVCILPGYYLAKSGYKK